MALFFVNNFQENNLKCFRLHRPLAKSVLPQLMIENNEATQAAYSGLVRIWWKVLKNIKANLFWFLSNQNNRNGNFLKRLDI
jgi:hypothetical protein